MTTEETEIVELLKQFPNCYVSVIDIARSIGSRKNLQEDRSRAQSILRRMEMEGSLEANSFEEYRLKTQAADTTLFKKALETPGMTLGDTAIISLSDVTVSRTGAA